MRNLCWEMTSMGHGAGRRRARTARVAAAALATLVLSAVAGRVGAQGTLPSLTDANLTVRSVVTGLTQPTGMAFMTPNDFFVIEKSTGRVRRILNGLDRGPVLDLAVNSFSERGLLGITLDPDFAHNQRVYLYWTCRAAVPADPTFPAELECPDVPELGADSTDVLAVPLLGNRLDRFIWNGSTLEWEQNLIKLRAFQNDGAAIPPNQGDQGQAPLGGANGGVLRFGSDGKLYVVVGENGRRGKLQNLPSGPTATGLGPTVPDDQFGGPDPDNAHFTGAILRLNRDGTAPSDNPFFQVGAAMVGLIGTHSTEVGLNIEKIFGYGIRNSFGMAVDPISGDLWITDNGNQAFDEINRVEAGFNSGWPQIVGPVGRLQQFKASETTLPPGTLGQLRWPASRIADTAQEALARLFLLPGARYHDPEFSWRSGMPNSALGFLSSAALGAQYTGDMFVGSAVTQPLGGSLFRFHLTGDRRQVVSTDARLADGVADNTAKFDLTESESLLFGTGFGVVTDIQTGPNGNLFVLSLTNGTLYEIARRA